MVRAGEKSRSCEREASDEDTRLDCDHYVRGLSGVRAPGLEQSVLYRPVDWGKFPLGSGRGGGMGNPQTDSAPGVAP